jgi:hypothetical protein
MLEDRENDEMDDSEDNDDMNLLFDPVDEEEQESITADLKETIKSLHSSLNFDQRDELCYILDNIESVPWDWSKWVK